MRGISSSSASKSHDVPEKANSFNVVMTTSDRPLNGVLSAGQ